MKNYDELYFNRKFVFLKLDISMHFDLWQVVVNAINGKHEISFGYVFNRFNFQYENPIR